MNMTEANVKEVPVVLEKRQGPFWASLSPFTKVMWVATGVASLMTIIGWMAEAVALLLIGVIPFGILVFVWISGGHYVSAKSRGADNPGAWALGAFVGYLLAPLGAVIFWLRWNAKLGEERRGFCPQCGRRIGFELAKCPFCGCVFCADKLEPGQRFSEISAEAYADQHKRTVEEVVADIKSGRLMGIKRGDFWYVDGLGKTE
jgi:hypothetical protein